VRTRWVLGLLLLAGLAALAAGAPLVSGVFSDAGDVGGNTFTVAEGCPAATVRQVQSGTATSSVDGTVAAAIPIAVDPARSFLIFTVSSNNVRPVGTELRGRLASGTSVEFVRVTDEGTPSAINVSWSVVEYECGVNVYRGDHTLTSALTQNLTIPTVAATAQAFVLTSATTIAADATTGGDDLIVADLTSTTNLQLRVDTAATDHIVGWQVVEFVNAADINVQRGNVTSLTGVTLTGTATVASTDTAKTFVLTTHRSSGGGADIGARLVRAALTNATTITFTRAVAGTPDNITEVSWQAVELKDGSLVQGGTLNLANSTATNTAAISPVATNQSVAFGSSQGYAGQSMGSSNHQGAGWYDPAWGFRKQLTVDYTKVTGAQTDFPVLMNLTTDASLAANAKADGDDILLTSADGTTKLSHEVETYVTATGQLVAWVKVPSLSNVANTVLYLYYGNSGAAAQANPTAVWDASYKGVWHMNVAPTGSASDTSDSTSTNNEGTSQGTMGAGNLVAGQVGSGYSFDGVNDFVSTATSFVNPQNVTVEAWVKTPSAGGRKVVGFENSQTGNPSNSDRLIYVGTTDGKARFGTWDGTTDVATSSASVADNAWHHVVGVHDDAADLVSIYVDGVFQQSTAATFAQNYTGWWKIGAYGSGGWPNGINGYFPGILDEVRVSHSLRSAAWIATQHANQRSPGTFFLGLGAAEPAGANAGVASVRATLISPTVLSLTRDYAPATAGSTDIAWYVVRWGAPSGSDVTAPVISRSTVAKVATPLVAGAIRQGGAYYVYAEVTDAVGVASVTTDTSTLDAGVTAAAMATAGGPWTVSGQSYAYRSASLTADTPLWTGSSYAYSIDAADAIPNSVSQAYSATIQTYNDTVQDTAGLVAYWHLGASPTGADSFTDTPGVALAAHGGEIASSWTRHAASTGSGVISSEDRARKSTTGYGVYYSSAVPTSADYAVEADLHVKSLIPNSEMGVVGRLSTGADTYYSAHYEVNTNDWNLAKVVSGVRTYLDYAAVTPLTVGQTYRVRLDMVGTTLNLYVNGELIPTLGPVTDTAIASVGRGGLKLDKPGSTASGSDSAGIHPDSFRVYPNTGTVVVDSKGTNTGTLVNSPLQNEPGALVGDFDGAVRLNGTSHHATFPDATALDLGDGPFTIEGWIKRTVAGTGPWRSVITKGTDSPQMLFDGNDRFMFASANRGSIADTTGTTNDITTWHHYVVTKNGAAVKVYIDGVDRTSTLTARTLASNAEIMVMGCKDGTPAECTGAILDDFAIYKTVMTQATALDHYNAGAGLG